MDAIGIVAGGDQTQRDITRKQLVPPAIDVAQFSFAYPDEGSVFEALDWQVPQGAFMLLVGATGSGKTTLLRNLKPEIAPVGDRQGAVQVLGKPLDDWGEPVSATGIGYVAQSPENQIVCDTVWHELAFGLENLGTPPDAMRRRVAEVAHFFGIEPWIRASTAELSGGQKQMVNLAAVLVMQPQVLLLDEPTAQLDPVGEKNFLHALFRINRELGITVVVATHAPESMVDYATGCCEINANGMQEVPLDRFGPDDVENWASLRTSACPPPRSRGTVAPDPASTPSRGNAADSAVEVHAAFFRYAKDAEWVLRGCDLSVRAGSLHAVVGGNGSGKSTLLRLAACVLKPERGRVRNAFARTQALLPQDPKALFVCDTVWEEAVEWQARCGYDDETVWRALREFGLDGLPDRHPYDLSGGQQQKLALVKILLTKPDLLLLDEPTKGLDAPSKYDVAKKLLTLAHEGKTILLSTHDLAFASQVADTVTMLFDGEATCTESTDAFFGGNLFYRPPFDGFLRFLSLRKASDASDSGGFRPSGDVGPSGSSQTPGGSSDSADHRISSNPRAANAAARDSGESEEGVSC